MEKWREPKTFAFDLHGVIDTDPEVLKNLMYYLLSTGANVIVLSGAPETQVAEELRAVGYARGIHYRSILSVVDWLKSKNVPMRQTDKGHWFTKNEDDWWGSKARMCAEYKIDVLYDDRVKYHKYIDSNAVYPRWFFHTLKPGSQEPTHDHSNPEGGDGTEHST